MIKLWQVGYLIALLIYLALLLATPINLTNVDLGRHIKNGEIILNTFKVPETNFYSYTYPDYPFVNHHWGSGVIFYLLYQTVGFIGISIFFILISLATFLVLFDLAKTYANFYIASFIAVVLIPLISVRAEIRPEVFSYFLSALFFWVLWNFKENKISFRWLFVLPFLELIWVNLHIYFPLGVGLIGIFLADQALNYLKDKKDLKKLKVLGLVILISIVATFLNPLGSKGAIYPIHIFDNYAYRLFENQTFFFIERLFSYPPILFFKIALGLLIFSFVYYLLMVLKKRQSISLSLILLNLGFAYLGIIAIRNFTHFGFFALALICLNISYLKNWTKKLDHPSFNYLSFPLILLTALTGLIIINPNFFQYKRLGLGLEENNLRALDFFKEQNIKGPIFNNYDNGGYLIYGLYPKEKIFVDNRPEAYPASFFTDVYIPMQEKEDVWQKLQEQYKFNTIFFNRLDLTPWGQQFLISRVKDKSWVPIFIDDNSLIFVKNNEQNKELIQKYKLPQEMFKLPN